MGEDRERAELVASGGRSPRHSAAPPSRPGRREFGARLPTILLTLAIGAVGGILFHVLGLPLAWMLGSMTAATIASVAGAPVALPAPLRSLMVAVLGVMLGSAFTPDLLARLPLWGGSLAALVVYVAVTTALCHRYFRAVGGYDPVTAYFAAAPGGLAEMILAGAAAGGDERVIALNHAARILVIVLLLPLGLQLFAGYQPQGRPPVGDALQAIPAADLVILLLCGSVGFLAAGRAGLPAAALVGPMALSALVHLLGLTESRPPAELVAAAQLVVGAAIGSRFLGTGVAALLRTLALALGAALLLLLTGAAFGLALQMLLGLPLTAVLLAFAPGGVAEMSLVALALGIDAAFVATHHVARIFLVVVAVPLAFRALRCRRQTGPQ